MKSKIHEGMAKETIIIEDELAQVSLRENAVEATPSSPELKAADESFVETSPKIAEVVESQVKSLSAKMVSFNEESETLKSEEREEKSCSGEESQDSSECNEDVIEEYPVVEIRAKSVEEEKAWITKTFNQLLREIKIGTGVSFRGRTVEDISASIPFVGTVKTSCIMKLSNFLEIPLTNPQYYFWNGTRSIGPSRVSGRVSEAIAFLGDEYYCQFLCSFEVTGNFRLTVYCCCQSLNTIIKVGIGFTPLGLPTNIQLYKTLKDISPLQDIRIAKEFCVAPLKFFVINGAILARVHMTRGPRSVVHVEIFEHNKIFKSVSEFSDAIEAGIKKRIRRGNSKRPSSFVDFDGTNSSLVPHQERFSCSIEIVNSLTVKLRSLNKFFCSCQNNDFIPLEVLPFEREMFFGTDSMNVIAMFSYEIESTDLVFVVTLTVGTRLNSFAVAFAQLSGFTGAKELESLEDRNHWKVHAYRKYATASEGTQLIQTRNIQAKISMTEANHCRMKIRIFAV